MLATLDALLRQPEFHLRLIAGAEPGSEALSTPLAWSHASDLDDPTPWLTPDGLLLTNGMQFVDVHDDHPAEQYVDRLCRRAVAGLGFATEIVHPTVPEGLVAACERRRLPLLEVADRAPFMAIMRFVADAQALEQRKRLEWSQAAQRGIARAALRPDGLNAVLLELEKQLGSWVALFDAAGERVTTATRLTMPAALDAEVATAVRRILARRSRGGVRIASGEHEVTLQTLGQHHQLRGVLAVATRTPLDSPETDLVSSVIALASIALDQTSALTDGRRHLRAGLFELMLAGAVDVAGRSAAQLWGPLPSPPIRVCVLAPGPQPGSLWAELERLCERRPGRLFFAEHAGTLVAITGHDDTAALRTMWERAGLRGGGSTSRTWLELQIAFAEARRAVARTSEERPFLHFDDLIHAGMLGLLDAAGGDELARGLLQPLTSRPAEERSMLLNSMNVWLSHNGAWDPAAKRLGVHRHTLRNRVALVEGLLGLDLRRFADRVELWAALELSESVETPVASVSVTTRPQQPSSTRFTGPS